MKTRTIPALIMLLAGAVACVAGIMAKLEIVSFTKMLLIVLVVFYILGCIVKIVLDRNFPETQEEETTEGNTALEEAVEEQEEKENQEK
ncbi:MAG: hypothetical protein PUB98_00250 [Clostridiales bacterium]|nr:hypothetical protein [Clostridiales bacterium]